MVKRQLELFDGQCEYFAKKEDCKYGECYALNGHVDYCTLDGDNRNCEIYTIRLDVDETFDLMDTRRLER
jgi:hypothetical protein